MIRSLILLISLLLISSYASAQAGPNDAVYGRFTQGVLGYAIGVNLNSVADIAIPISATKYIVRKVITTNC